MPGGRWIWEIHQNGTYTFHSEGVDKLISHAGIVGGANGRGWLRASSGYLTSALAS